MKETISTHMTKDVHTTGRNRTLAEAHRIMNLHGIRHLPVVEGGKLVGMVTQRDLHLVETLKGVNADEVKVDEAMSPDLYAVAPDTPLRQVAHEMATHKYGSAVVVDGGRLMGIFTTVDALRALEQLLGERRPRGGKVGHGHATLHGAAKRGHART